MRVEDCIAIVTGAASGLGRQACADLRRAGAAVAAVDKDRGGLADLGRELDGYGDRLAIVPADVTCEEQVATAVADACAAHGPANVLVNAAGIYRDGLLVRPAGAAEFVTMPLAQWRAVVEADLTGTFLMARAVAAQMVRTGTRPGAIVTISSVSRDGNAGQGNYAAAKAGVVAFTRTMALELAGYGIRAAAIAPGFIDTPILAAVDPARLAERIQAVPLRRLGTPAEISAGIRFVIECEYFTGRCLDIDGGLAM